VLLDIADAFGHKDDGAHAGERDRGSASQDAAVKCCPACVGFGVVGAIDPAIDRRVAEP
jgi:hypothetical protein